MDRDVTCGLGDMMLLIMEDWKLAKNGYRERYCMVMANLSFFLWSEGTETFGAVEFFAVPSSPKVGFISTAYLTL